jgi:hypothetical protein
MWLRSSGEFDLDQGTNCQIAIAHIVWSWLEDSQTARDDNALNDITRLPIDDFAALRAELSLLRTI